MKAKYDFTGAPRGLFYPEPERIERATGDLVYVERRGRDEQGAFAEIRRSDGMIERVHPSQLRPLSWLEMFDLRAKRKLK